MTFREYYRDAVVLGRYKVRDLQRIARHNAVSPLGPKRVLVPRIEKLFQMSLAANHIQRFVRGSLSRIVLRLRAAGADRAACRNATDFYTMESVEEIPQHLYVRYVDAAGFAFGFNVHSLLAYYKIKGVFVNPYNRDEFPRGAILAILRFYLLTVAVFKRDVDRSVTQYGSLSIEEGRAEALGLYKLASRAYAIEFALYSAKVCKRPRSDSMTSVNGPDMAEVRETVREKVLGVRAHGLEDRVRLAFDEINSLGNYSQAAWFTSLEKMEYVRFYNYIYNVWRYHGAISTEAKESICCLGDPFNHRFILRFVYSENTIERIRELCISLVEDLVFTGIDDEYRRLGALHVLTALTLVSSAARGSLPWLYESIM
jgi:hypothetical protein